MVPLSVTTWGNNPITNINRIAPITYDKLRTKLRNSLLVLRKITVPKVLSNNLRPVVM